jgi:cysteinyl-tRNA synthetase
LQEAERELAFIADHFFGLLANQFNNDPILFARWLSERHRPSEEMLHALADDLNTPAALASLRSNYHGISRHPELAGEILSSLEILGVVDRQTLFLNGFPILRGFLDPEVLQGMNLLGRKLQISVLNKNKSFPEDVDLILREGKIGVEFGPGSLLFLIRKEQDVEQSRNKIDELIASRAAARARKDFTESDRIRDELAAMGVVLKDSKDANGNPITTWEIAR